MEKSGYYLPGRTGLRIFLGLETVLGKSGLIAMLRYSKLTQFIDNYPPNTTDPVCDFADLSALHHALEDLYGGRGGKVLMMHVGREIWDELLGPLADPQILETIKTVRDLPEEQRASAIMQIVKTIYNATGDWKTEFEEVEDAYLLKMKPCPCCWGRKMEQPGCHVIAGYIQGAILWSTGQQNSITQTTCSGCGDNECTFKVSK